MGKITLYKTKKARLFLLATLCCFVFGMNVSFAQTTILSEGFENGGNMPSGWTIIDHDGDGYNWEIKSRNSYYSVYTGTYACCSYSDWIGDNLPDNYLVSPQIALPATFPAEGGLFLSWWVKLQSGSAPELYSVYVSTTGNTVADFQTGDKLYEGEATTSMEWTQRTVDLSEYAGQSIYFAIRHHSEAKGYIINFDDILVQSVDRLPAEIYTSVNRVNLPQTEVEESSVSEAITVTSRSLDVLIVASIAAPFSLSTDGTTFASSVALSAEGGTLYVKYTPAVTGDASGTLSLAGGTATASVPVSGMAYSCNTELSYFEYFDSGGHNCWSFWDRDGDGFGFEYMESHGTAQGASSEAYTEPGMIVSESVSSTGAPLTPDNWFISPAIQLTTGLRLTWRDRAWSADKAAEQYGVYATTVNPATAQLSDYTELFSQTLSSTTWLEREVTLPAKFTGETVYIAFRHFGNTNQSMLCLDNFIARTSEPATCDMPQDLTISLSGKTATATWDAVDGAEYHIRLNNRTPIAVITNTYQFTNLAVGNHIIYLRTVCDEDMEDYSGWASRSFTVEEAPPCPEPTSLSISVVNYKASIEWTDEEATAWEVRLNDETPIAVAYTSYQFTGLASGVHTAYVRAVCDEATDSYSEWVSTSFTVEEVECTEPVSLLSHVTGYSAMINWSLGEDVETEGIQWEIRLNDDTPTLVSYTSYQFTDLEPDDYTVSVRMVCANGNYSAWASKSFTIVEIPVTEFTVNNADDKPITYYITSSTEPYTVEVRSTATGYSGNIVIPATVEYKGITYTVTSIGAYSMISQSTLTGIVIPNTVTSIGSMAFYYCTALTHVTIGEAVATIGSSAFSSCSGISEIICYAFTPPAIQSSTFSGVSTDIPVKVPCGMVEDYEAAEHWSNFTNYEEAGGGDGVITYTATICFGETYTEHGFNASETGTYTLPIEDDPCYTSKQLNLTVVSEIVKPTDLTITRNEDKLDISWQGNAPVYELYRGANLAATLSTNSYQYTGVMNGVEYCFSVKGINGDCEGELSDEVCFTPQGSSTVLLAEDFEHGGEMPEGWTVIDSDGDGNNFVIRSNLNYYRVHSGNYAICSYSDWIPNPATNDNYLVTPQVVLPAGEEINLGWWVALQGGFPESYEVYISTTGNTISDFTTLLFEESIAPEDQNWRFQTVDLSEYAGQSIYIAFRHIPYLESDYYGYMINFDDIIIQAGAVQSIDVSYTMLNCPFTPIGNSSVSQAITVTGYSLPEEILVTVEGDFKVSSDEVTFDTSTTLPAEGGQFYLRFAPETAGPATGKVILTSGTASAEISLTGSAYDCTEPKALPFVDDFNYGSHNCWYRLDRDDDGLFFDFMTGATIPHSVPGMLVSASMYDDGLGTVYPLTPDNWVISPALVLPESGAKISWFAKAYLEGYSAEHYGVYVTTELTGDISYYTELFTETLNGTIWQEREVNIPASFAGQTVYIAFRHFDCTGQYLLFIDDVSVEEAIVEPCANPTNLVVNQQDETVTIIWNEGDAAEWEVRLDEEDAIVVAVSNHQFEGLSVGMHTISVRAICGKGDYSEWVEISFTTTGLGELETSGLAVYPNPVKDLLRVESIDDITKVEIVNLTGQTVYSQPVSGTSAAINVSAFAKGTYVVKIHTSKGLTIKKIVKE